VNPRTRRLVIMTFFVALGWACAPPREAPDSTEPAASGLPMAEPADVGLSADALARIGPAMQAYVDDGRLAGVVTMVARRGRVVHWEAVGFRDLELDDPLERDDLLRVYSMTKPVTSVAVMMLVEEGLVSLDDSISTYIPEFDGVRVLTESGWAGAANTFFWIDPEEELIGMVWTQISPFGLYPIEREFQTLVYEAIED